MNSKFICEKCGMPFENGKIKSNHIRWKHGDINKYRESNKIASLKVYDEKKGKLKSFDVACELCKKHFQVKERENQFPKKEKYFCSKKCAGEYSQSFVKKENQMKALKKHWENIPKVLPKTHNFICVVCNNPFSIMSKKKVYNKKTCSKECYTKLLHKWTRENPNCGGELGYKRFYYKNILMDSSWEVEIAKWMDEKDIVWDRSRKRHMFWWTDECGNRRRYYPDFYLPKLNVYLDPKNKHKLMHDLPKLKCVIRENKINLLYGEINDIKKNIDRLMVV